MNVTGNDEFIETINTNVNIKVNKFVYGLVRKKIEDVRCIFVY